MYIFDFVKEQLGLLIGWTVYPIKPSYWLGSVYNLSFSLAGEYTQLGLLIGWTVYTIRPSHRLESTHCSNFSISFLK